MYRSRLKASIKKLRALFVKLGWIKPTLLADRTSWQIEDQKFELEFHKTNVFRQSDQFMDETTALFTSFGYNSAQFDGKTILDLGAGSRLRGKFFSNTTLIAIEPLAREFVQEISWCDLGDARNLYSTPAEILIDELTGIVDFVFSINVLDHCYDFVTIIQNIYTYLHVDGEAFLSFDSHYHASVGHPLILTEEICKDVFIKTGFEIVSFRLGFPQTFLEVHPRPGYDGKSDSLNFKLKKVRKQV